jgi:hypothetical protein
MRMNCVAEKASGLKVPTLIWVTFSNVFGLEEGWRIFPGVRAQTANDFRRSLLTCGKPECSSTFPFIQRRLSVPEQVCDNGLFGTEFQKYYLKYILRVCVL